MATTELEAATRPLAFVDLGAQHAEIRESIEEAFRDIVDESGFIGGPRVEAFESAFAEYVGTTHAVGVASGTDAVKLALQAAGVRQGDAVLTVSHTFIGTVEGALQIGARPLFLDIDPATRNLSADSLARVLDEDCKREGDVVRHVPTGLTIGAILPVHLYGHSADMPRILELAARYGVPVVEDAAQAHGARCRFPDGRVAACGSMGRSAAFSFYPGKNLGAMGEAGAVTTDLDDLADGIRILRDHGQARKYVHRTAEGGNSRLDAIQAAVLRLKLDRLETWNERRRRAADAYREQLADLADHGLLEIPGEAPWAYHVYHLFVVHTPARDSLHAALGERGIPTGFHYPIPLHLQPAFEGQGLEAEPLPETERAAATCLSLPMHPHLTESQIRRVTDAIREILPGLEG